MKGTTLRDWKYYLRFTNEERHLENWEAVEPTFELKPQISTF